jgi:hypothetical protein
MGGGGDRLGKGSRPVAPLRIRDRGTLSFPFFSIYEKELFAFSRRSISLSTDGDQVVEGERVSTTRRNEEAR